MDKREEFLEDLRRKYIFKRPKVYTDLDPDFLEEELERRANLRSHEDNIEK